MSILSKVRNLQNIGDSETFPEKSYRAVHSAASIIRKALGREFHIVRENGNVTITRSLEFDRDNMTERFREMKAGEVIHFDHDKRNKLHAIASQLSGEGEWSVKSSVEVIRIK